MQNDETLPDLTAQYRYGGDWGHCRSAGVLRKVGFEVRASSAADAGSSGSETGWGINVGSMINTIGNDKILLQVVYGEGIANYMNDGGMDLAPTASFDEDAVTDVEAEAIPLTGMLAYYDHWWVAQVVELDRLQLHGSGQHQLPVDPTRSTEDRIRLGATCCTIRART